MITRDQIKKILIITIISFAILYPQTSQSTKPLQLNVMDNVLLDDSFFRIKIELTATK